MVRLKAGVSVLLMLSCVLHISQCVEREIKSTRSGLNKKYKETVPDSNENDGKNLAERRSQYSDSKSTKKSESKLAHLTQVRFSTFSQNPRVLEDVEEEIKKVAVPQLREDEDAVEDLIRDTQPMLLENLKPTIELYEKNSERELEYKGQTKSDSTSNNSAEDQTVTGGKSKIEELKSSATIHSERTHQSYSDDSFLRDQKPHMVGHWKLLVDSPIDSKLEVGTVRTEQHINPIHKGKTYKKSIVVNDLRLRVPGTHDASYHGSAAPQSQPVLLMRNVIVENKVIPKGINEYSSNYATLKRSDLSSPHSGGTSPRFHPAAKRSNTGETYSVGRYQVERTGSPEFDKSQTRRNKEVDAENRRYSSPYVDISHESGYQNGKSHLSGSVSTSKEKERYSTELSYQPKIQYKIPQTRSSGNVQQKKAEGVLPPVWDEERVPQSTGNFNQAKPFSKSLDNTENRKQLQSHVDLDARKRSFVSEQLPNQMNYAIHSRENQPVRNERPTTTKSYERGYTPDDQRVTEHVRPYSEVQYYNHPKHVQLNGRSSGQTDSSIGYDTKKSSGYPTSTGGYKVQPARSSAEGNQIYKLNERQINGPSDVSVSPEKRSGAPKYQNSDRNLKDVSKQRETPDSPAADKPEGNENHQPNIARSDVPKQLAVKREQVQKIGKRRNESSEVNSRSRRIPRKGRKKVTLTARRDSDDDNLKASEAVYHWGMENHRDIDGYFQYVNNPEEDTYEYGYRMGSPGYTQERYHHTSGTQFKTKVNWEDDIGNFGDQYWEFNHGTPQKENSYRTIALDSSHYEDDEE